MGIKLTYAAFDKALKRLAEKYLVIGPVRQAGKGTYSDTDLIGYGEISSADALVLSQKSNFSPKEYIFPLRETLFNFNDNQLSVPQNDIREVIIFLRPCDINGIKRLDTIFLSNGGTEDFYYKRIRQKVKFFMIECREGFDSCFCVSMDSNKTDNYSCAFRFNEKEILVDVRDAAFKDAFGNGQEMPFQPEFVEENHIKVEMPPLKSLSDKGIFENPVWQEYTSRCIACGRCNVSCITCSCFTMYDVKSEECANSGCRIRVWASCHIDGFTDMAGGHSFRKKKGERMRFKTMHKINDFHRRFGFHMCVGCGRCDDVCPEYISFSKCISKLNDIIAKDIDE